MYLVLFIYDKILLIMNNFLLRFEFLDSILMLNGKIENEKNIYFCLIIECFILI